jgi:hypothetical protein
MDSDWKEYNNIRRAVSRDAGAKTVERAGYFALPATRIITQGKGNMEHTKIILTDEVQVSAVRPDQNCTLSFKIESNFLMLLGSQAV